MGGYQILDLKNTAFVKNTAQVLEGAYEKIEGTRKAILLTNVNVDGTEYHDTFIEGSGTPFTATVYGYTLTIADDDNVTFTKGE